MVAAVHPVERAIVDGLQAVFDRQVRPAGEFAQATRARRRARNRAGCRWPGRRPPGGRAPRHKLPQPLDRGIGVCRRLEIGDESLDFGVAATQLADALVDLLANGLPRQPPAGAEAAVVAKRAAAGGHGAVDVGAGEACVDADLLHPAAKAATQKAVVAAVAQPAPRQSIGLASGATGGLGPGVRMSV